MKRHEELKFGFSTVADGNMSYRFGDTTEVNANREKWLKSFGFKPNDFAGMRVEMSDKIVVVDESHKGLGMSTIDDALHCDSTITSKPGIGLWLMIADCLPILMYDPMQKAVAIVHCGWQGTDLELARKTIEKMSNLYGSKPADIVVRIGPGIKKDSYKFDEPSQKSDPRWHPHLETDEANMTAIDILGFNNAQLVKAGVPTSNIVASDVDTATDEAYFSHYRAARTGEAEGRFAAFIYLEV